MKLIDRHLLATYVPPFLFGLTVTTFLLMINVLQVYLNLLLEKGISLAVVAEMIVLSLGHIIALSVPMASLVGVLMAVGHLAGDQEITALKACGVGLYRITQPLLGIGVFLTLLMTAHNHYVLPDGNHRLKNLLFEIQQMRPTLEIRPNTFAEISDEYTIFVRFKEDKTGELEDVILYKREGKGDATPDVIVAQTGLLKTLGPSRIRLDLFDGELHHVPDPENPATYNRTKFAQQTFMVKLDVSETRIRRGTSRGDREMDLHQLSAAIARQDSVATSQIEEARGSLREVVEAAYAPLDPGALAGETPDQVYEHWLGLTRKNAQFISLHASRAQEATRLQKKYAVEWHKKFSIPFACTVFVIVGVPLAVVSARGGRGVSVGLSLLAFTVYYSLLTSGEKLADRQMVEPWIGMWTPNLVVGVVGVILLRRAVTENPTIDFRWAEWVGALRRRRA